MKTKSFETKEEFYKAAENNKALPIEYTLSSSVILDTPEYDKFLKRKVELLATTGFLIK